MYFSWSIALLLLHGLTAVALLGALTHQLVAVCSSKAVGMRAGSPERSFVQRYIAVGYNRFANAIVIMYVVVVVLGAVIYPQYRVDARVSFEEMSLFWAVGLFEIKEHWGGVGLGILPLYAYVWRSENIAKHATDRKVITVLLATIVWSDFIAGHFLNNIRGL